jgi:hypothetical protein
MEKEDPQQISAAAWRQVAMKLWLWWSHPPSCQQDGMVVKERLQNQIYGRGSKRKGLLTCPLWSAKIGLPYMPALLHWNLR